MSGIVVVGVASGSKGADAGVQVGDIIKEVNLRVIENVKDYTSALQKLKSGEDVNLFIWRRNAGFLVIKLTK
jgi:S1-C subfamily serine protease